jgi:hypothetical protein
MKKYILTSALSLLGIFQITSSNAQENIAPDQNPQYAVSRARYMKIADSVNPWHGTTFPETYKAFDWYENKMEKRKERQQFRRELRTERARQSRYYSPYRQRGNYYSPYYNNYYNRYNRQNWWSFWCF